MLDIIRKIWRLVGTETRRGVFWLSAAMLVAALLESIGLGLFVPILGLMFDPASLDRIPGAAWAYQTLAGGSMRVLLVQFCAMLLAFFIVKAVVVGSIIYVQNRFLMTRQAAFSCDLLRSYLDRDYKFHLQRNSAELVRNVNLLSTRLFLKGMFPVLQAVMELLTLAGAAVVLLWVHPVATLLLVVVLGASGFLFYLGIRRPIARWGDRAIEYDGTTLQATNEALGSVKLVQLGGHAPFFTAAFARPAMLRARYLALSNTATYLPRLFIEVATIATMLLVLMALLFLAGEEPAGALPILAVFGVAGLRLMPSISRIMGAATQLRENSGAVDILTAEMKGRDERSAPTPAQPARKRAAGPPGIALDGVSFAYTDEDAAVLDGVSLAVPPGTSAAIVGPSGAGKTTLIDAVLGLLTPDAGRVLVDGEDIRTNIARWQRRIGYVPQDIYLIDDTLARNIAMGWRDDEIDRNQLRRAIKIAQLDELVASLPQGVDTPLGDRGSRLSGGQRQRVGIARALYTEPDVLVMDEATSALDIETGHRLGEALAAFAGQRTVIVIAHHLATIRNCDQIVMMEDGRVRATGDFAGLQQDAEFSRLLAMSSIGQATKDGR